MYAEQGEYRTGSEQDGPRRTGVGDHQGAASALGGCPSTSRARARCCARLQLCAQRLGGREPGGVRAITLAAGALQAQARHGIHQRAALLKRGELPEDGCDHLGRIAQQPCTRTSPVLLKPWSIMRVRIEAFSAYASERSAHMPVATFSIESVACPPPGSVQRAQYAPAAPNTCKDGQWRKSGPGSGRTIGRKSGLTQCHAGHVNQPLEKGAPARYVLGLTAARALCSRPTCV